LFKSGKLRYLVATDVAARGIDIEAMPLVVHMGIPTQMESYIHRSGRTGRAGAKGASLALVSPKESRILLAWSRRGGLKLEWRSLPNRAEIREIRAQKLSEHIASIEAPIHLDSARKMLAGRDAQSLVAALLSTIIGKSQDGYDLPSLPKYDYTSEKSQYSNRSRDKQERGDGQRSILRKNDKPKNTRFSKKTNNTRTKRTFDHTEKPSFMRN
jgi:ATP-dependent RNA helicase DeaD